MPTVRHPLGHGMPIYEYVCLDCGEKFDALRSMAQADAPIGCRACEGEHTSRTISVFAAVSEGRVVAGSNGGGGSAGGGGALSARWAWSFRSKRPGQQTG